MAKQVRWRNVESDIENAVDTGAAINTSVWKSAFKYLDSWSNADAWLGMDNAVEALEEEDRVIYNAARDVLEQVSAEANIKEGFVLWALENKLATDRAQAEEFFNKSKKNTIDFPEQAIEIAGLYPSSGAITQEEAVALWMAGGKGEEILLEIAKPPFGDPASLQGADKRAYKNQLATALKAIDAPDDDETDAEIAKKQDEFWERYAEQCALMSNLDQFAAHHREQRRDNPYHFGGRIIPFVSGEGDEDIINILRGRHQNLNKFTSEADKNIYPFIGHDLRLQIVRPTRVLDESTGEYTIGRGDDEEIVLETVPISLTTAKFNTATNIGTGSAITGGDQTVEAVTSAAIDEVLAPLGGRIVFESFSYTMDGSNPATARKDVTAELNFSFSDISYLTKELIETSTGGNLKYKISDLITYPRSIENSLGIGASSKNQYSPDYNRIRAVITTKIDDDDLDAEGQAALKSAVGGLNESFESATMVLNLALEDHELSINKKQHLQYDLKISYRGFMETALKSPMMNALADDKIFEERKVFEQEKRDAIQEATAAGCPVEVLREIKKNYSRLADSQVVRSQMSMWKRLYEYGFVQKIGIKEQELLAASKDKEFIYKKIFSDTLIKAAGEEDEARVDTIARKKVAEEAKQGGYETEMHFLYLGDLLYVMADVLYIDSTNLPTTSIVDRLKPEVNHLNYRMGVGSFLWKDPNLPKGADAVSVNIADIPISLNFFKRWYDEVVIKKDRKFYSVIVMAMDLVERLVTNVLNEVCVNFENDENVRFRVAHFESVGDPLLDFLEDKGEEPVINLAEASGGVYPVFKTNSTALANEYTNYSIIYASSHNVYSEKHQSGKRTEISKNGIPIFNIKPVMDRGAIKTASFKRTNVPGLRESRYFNGGVGGVSLLSNHYSITMDLWPNTYFTPGMLIFVYLDEDNLGDPMDTTSLANNLGLGGYHLITRVATTIRGDGDFSNKIDAIWTRTTLSGVAKTTTASPSVETASEACREVLRLSDAAADRSQFLEALVGTVPKT